MNKKIYTHPQILVIHIGSECLLASVSGGITGKTEGFQGDGQQPNISFGGDAGKNNDHPEDGGYEIW